MYLKWIEIIKISMIDAIIFTYQIFMMKKKTPEIESSLIAYKQSVIIMTI